jgi:hypothetical protein
MINKYSGGLNNSNEHLTNAVIAAYINLKDNLSEKEISFIENHLNKCDECKSRLDKMIEEDIEIDDLAESTSSKKNNNYYFWAAAAMLIIAIGISMFYIFQQGNKEVIVQNEKPLADSLMTEEKTPDRELAEEEKETQDKTKEYNGSDFAANTTLENFINRNVRSEYLTKIMSPEIGDTLETPITFKWESNEERMFTFELVNNRNKSIIKQTLAENNFTYSNKLNPGLYYWKLLVDYKLEAVGKFYIE